MTAKSLDEAIKDFPNPISREIWGTISKAFIRKRGEILSKDEILSLVNRLSEIVQEPESGINIYSLFLAPDLATQPFFANVQRLAKKWSSPIDWGYQSNIKKETIK